MHFVKTRNKILSFSKRYLILAVLNNNNRKFTMKTIKLYWYGPYSFFELFSTEKYKDKFSHPGVYLWYEINEHNKKLAYVGKASGKPTLYERNFQHYINQIGGQYFIPEFFRKNSDKSWVLDVNDPTCRSSVLNMNIYHSIVIDSFNYICNISIYLCILHSNDVNLVERNLLYKLQPLRTKWGTKTEPSEKIKITNSGSKPFE